MSNGVVTNQRAVGGAYAETSYLLRFAFAQLALSKYIILKQRTLRTSFTGPLAVSFIYMQLTNCHYHS